MQVDKIKIGRHVNYTTSRGTQVRRGKVVQVYEVERRGHFITVLDSVTKKEISIRPRQVSV